MSRFDPTTLPEQLAEYFAATDHSATAHLFAAHAVVRDEGETLSGNAAILTWLNSVEARYHPRYAVTGAQTEGQHTVVTFIVSGTFPGSPATLRQAFVLQGGLIQSIETL